MHASAGNREPSLPCRYGFEGPDCLEASTLTARFWVNTSFTLAVSGVFLSACAVRDVYRLHRAKLLKCDSFALTLIQVALGSLSLAACNSLNGSSSLLPAQYMLHCGQKSATLFVPAMVSR